MQTMHRAERAQICYTLTDTRCGTRGYRHARASYGPPRATRAANGPGTIGPGPGPAPAAATPTVAPSLWRQLINAAAAAAAAAAGRLPGRWPGPSRAEPLRRSPTPRRAPRWLPLPCAPSPSRCRRQDLVGRPAGDSSCRCREVCGVTTRLAADNKSIHAKSTRDVCCDRQGACRTCL